MDRIRSRLFLISRYERLPIGTAARAKSNCPDGGNLNYIEIISAIFEKIALVWYHGTKNTGRGLKKGAAVRLLPGGNE